MKRNRILLAVAAATLASAAYADAFVTSVNAANSAIYRPAGVRTRTVSGNVITEERFFNVEGVNNGTNANWGILRFDAAGIKSSLDTQFGIGGWMLDGIDLLLSQSNAAFSKAGALEWAFTSDTTTPILYPNTTLKYDSSLTPASGQMSQDFVAAGTYEKRNNGDIDTYSLLADNVGGNALKSAILAGGLVTLIGNDGDEDVAATWAGAASTTIAKPVLRVSATAAIPEPSSLLLLVSGAPLLALRRRK